MASKRVFELFFKGDAKEALGSFDQISAKVGEAEGKFGKLGTAAVVGGAAIGTAAVAGAGALYKLGADFDDVYDGIATTTGATGKQLDSLKDSFRNVVKDVPTDFESAGKAIGELNQKTGLTGPALDGMAAKVLNLSRITGGDLTKNIDAAAKMTKDWGMPAEQASSALDKMFKASQQSGVGFDQLASTMDQFGPTLRGLGLTYDEGVALVAKLEKSGADVGTVFRGMSKDLVNANGDVAKSQDALNKAQDIYQTKIAEIDGKLAESKRALTEKMTAQHKTQGEIAEAITKLEEKAAGDRATALEKLTTKQDAHAASVKNAKSLMDSNGDTFKNQITAIQNTADKTEAMRLATELFGKKAAPEMFDTIKAGKFNIDEMAKSIGNGGDAINKTADNTADGHERMQIAFNRAKIALEPLATGMFTFGAQLTEKVAPAIETAAQALTGIADWASKHKEIVLGALVAIGTAVLVTVVPPFVAWAAATVIATAPVVAIGVAVAALGAAVVLAYQHFTPFREAVQAIGKFFKDDFLPIVQQVGEYIGTVLSGVIDTAKGVWERFGTAITTYVEGAFSIITAAVDTLVGVFRGLIQFVQGVFTGDWGKAWDGIKQAIGAVFDGIVAVVTTYATKILPALASITTAILGWVADVAVKLAEKLGEWLLKFLGWAAETLAKLPIELAKIGVALLQWVADVIPNLAAKLVGWTAEFLAFAVDTLAKLPAELAKIGAALLQWVGDKVGELTGALLKWTGEFSAFAVDSATKLPGELAKVISAVTGWISSKIGDVASAMTHWTKEVVDFAVDAASQAPGKLAGLLSAVTGWFTSKLGDISLAVAGWATSALSWVSSAVSSAPAEVGKFVTAVLNVLDDLPQKFAATAASMGKGIANGVISALNFAIDGINRFKITVGGWSIQAPFPPHPTFSVPSFTIDFPNIPRIPTLARGGEITEAGYAIVGDQGVERVWLPRGARVEPLDYGMSRSSASSGGASRTIVVVGPSAREVAMWLRDEHYQMAREGIQVVPV